MVSERALAAKLSELTCWLHGPSATPREMQKESCARSFGSLCVCVRSPSSVDVGGRASLAAKPRCHQAERGPCECAWGISHFERASGSILSFREGTRCRMHRLRRFRASPRFSRPLLEQAKTQLKLCPYSCWRYQTFCSATSSTLIAIGTSSPS